MLSSIDYMCMYLNEIRFLVAFFLVAGHEALYNTLMMKMASVMRVDVDDKV